MSLYKSSARAIFAAAWLLVATAGSAHAQCNNSVCATEWSGDRIINLGGLPGSTSSEALSINSAGQAVGNSDLDATEWSRGRVINLGGLSGSISSIAYGINDAGQAVGVSYFTPCTRPNGAVATSST
jgi:uncharacterized membrane protein